MGKCVGEVGVGARSIEVHGRDRNQARSEVVFDPNVFSGSRTFGRENRALCRWLELAEAWRTNALHLGYKTSLNDGSAKAWSDI